MYNKIMKWAEKRYYWIRSQIHHKQNTAYMLSANNKELNHIGMVVTHIYKALEATDVVKWQKQSKYFQDEAAFLRDKLLKHQNGEFETGLCHDCEKVFWYVDAKIKCPQCGTE